MTHPTRFTVTCPTRIVFGSGVSADITQHLGIDPGHVLVVRGGQGDALVAALRNGGHQVREVRCRMEPSVTLINDLLSSLGDAPVDAVVACGGGSVLDTGKALAFCLGDRSPLPPDFSTVPTERLSGPPAVPLIAVPTTAGTGAEVTQNAVLGLPDRKAKVSLRGPALAPAVALVDPDLMCSAPDTVVLHSGLDALVQIIEAYTSNAATPFSDALTVGQIEPGLRALRAILDAGDPSGWSTLAWVSLSSGMALANGGLGAAHGLASILGGHVDAPHGALCGLFLTPVLRQNLSRAAPGSAAHIRLDHCCAAIARVFPPLPGKDDLSGLETWVKSHHLPRLTAFGLGQDDLEPLAEQSVFASSSKKNAVALGRDDFLTILKRAL